MSPQSNAPDVGEPMYIVHPKEAHTHTMVLLHGLGSNGTTFGTELLETGITSSGQKLTSLLPGTRFVFPTSKRRRSSAFSRSLIIQWFDITRLSDPSYRQERQLQGLADSAKEIMAILAHELPNGSSPKPDPWRTEPRMRHVAFDPPKDLESAIAEEDLGENDPFYDTQRGQFQDRSVMAQRFERDLLSMENLENSTEGSTALLTPVFIGHGTADEKVPLALGEAAAKVVKGAGYHVVWKSYQEQGHWYKIPDEINDIVNFIASQVGWQISDDGIGSQMSQMEKSTSQE